MKVVWALPRFNKPRTGGEKVLEKLIELLCSRGDEIIEVYAESETKNGVLGTINKQYQNYRILRAEDGKAPIIQNLLNRPEYFIANILLRYLKGRRIVLFVKETYEDEGFSVIRKQYHRFINNITFRSVSLIVVNSQYTGDWVCRYGDFRDKIHILYPVLKSCSNSVVRVGKKPSDSVNILCVGNIRRNKGQIYLLEAFKDLPAHVKVTFVGMVKEDEYMDKLQRYIEDHDISNRVRFTGFLSDFDLFDEYSKADLFVSPTLKEGFGQAVHEAMAHGLPVIASRVGALSEIVEDGKSGILVAPENSKALADAIRRIVGNVEYGNTLGKEARARSTIFQTVDAQVDVLRGLFMKLRPGC